jgi:hypothetical protein
VVKALGAEKASTAEGVESFVDKYSCNTVHAGRVGWQHRPFVDEEVKTLGGENRGEVFAGDSGKP